MDDTPTTALDEQAQQAAGLPKVIGPYQVRGLLGEGGMGRVYLAHESHPERDVALKVVRGVSSAALERFQREIELLGQLEHPGIVRLYAAGEDRVAGLPSPWFALELVRGPDLRGYLTQQTPSVPARVELLVKLARAVDYAHRRGIVHRDLKPSNILVDEHGQPKILDFGIARLQGAEGNEMTQMGQVMGTLPYMSPEQLSGNSRDVDARSDVYALGAIGYELLAGRLPHPRLSSSTLFEALDIVRREQPEPLAKINRHARGDLSIVVMKALAAEPSQRYDSAAAFADDLEAVLQSRPIKARAPTWTYRSGRFIRRNRALSAAMVLVFVALTAATVVSTLAAQRAQAALAEAQARTSELTAVNGFVESMLTEADPEVGGSAEMPLRDVLNHAEQTLGTQHDSPRTDGQVALLLGRTWSGLGESDRAQRLLDRAQRLLDAGFGDDSKESMEARFARVEDFARTDHAKAALNAAVALEQRLASIHAAWARAIAFRTKIVKAQVMEADGDADGAIALDQQLLASPELNTIPKAAEWRDTLRHNLAYALTVNRADGSKDAEKLLRETLASETRRLGADHPQTLYTKKALGQALHRQGRLDEAVPLYAEVYAKRSKQYGLSHPLTLASGGQLASAYNTLGRPAEAEPLLRQQLAYQRSHGEAETPDSLGVRVMLATSLEKLGKPDDAIAMANEAIAIEHGEPNMHTIAARNVKAVALLNKGQAHAAKQVWVEALSLLLATLGENSPNYASTLANAARADLALGDFQSARKKLEPALRALSARMGKENSRVMDVAERMATTYEKLGELEKARLLRLDYRLASTARESTDE